jgi:hypothetical protein
VKFAIPTPDVVAVKGPTDENGMVMYDLTPIIGAATVTSEGYGGWTVTADFLGMTV